MNTDKENGRSESQRGSDIPRGLGLLGWLNSLRSRFGFAGSQSLRDTIENALKEDDTHSAGAFSAEEREMLARLLRFGASRVVDIMVPRADIIAIEEGEPLRELVLTFEEAGVSRIPLFHETLDDPRGMVHIKDLFRWLSAEASGRPLAEPRTRSETRAGSRDRPGGPAGNDATAEAGNTPPDLNRIDLSRPISSTKLRRPVLYVPLSMSAMNLLVRMQASRIHMALVVDEYGGTDGLVTIEDLVEQIVGDIEDEHDEAEASLISNDPKLGLTASGRAPVKELEEYLGIELLKPGEEENIDTLGGLVFQIVGRVPARGEIVRHSSGVEFEVLDADPRRVKKLKIHRPKVGGLATESATAGSKE